MTAGEVARRFALATDLRELARKLLAAEPSDVANVGTVDELSQAAAWLDAIVDRLPL